MSQIVVTASTQMELSLLIQEACAVPVGGGGHLPTFRGVLGEREVIVAVTGVGKVNAASAATVLLERYRPALMINTGCGGAFAGSGLSVGGLALASSECFADEGVLTPQGWRGLDLIGIPVGSWRGEPLFNRIPLCEELSRAAFDCLRERGFRGERGAFLTVSTCSGTAAQGAELLRRFPGICENMEGAALAQVALVYDVPFLEVRGISNLVEDRDLSRWDLRRAVSEAQKFLLTFLKDSSLEC